MTNKYMEGGGEKKIGRWREAVREAVRGAVREAVVGKKRDGDLAQDVGGREEEKQ